MRAHRTGPVVTTVVALSLVAAACGGPAPQGQPGPGPGDGGPGGGGPVAAAPLDRGEARELARSVNAFGFDLLGDLDDGDNVVVSPLSVSVLLAMVLAGAAGDTAGEIAATLHLDPSQSRHDAYAALLAELTGTGEVTMEVANSLWAMLGVPFEEDYLEFVRDVFAATVDEVDLGSPETAERIDAWVRERTNDLIDGIAEDLGLPDPSMVLALVNAVYFKGAWTDPFDPASTRDAPFATAAGGEVTVPTMTADRRFEILFRDDLAVLRLPYGDDERFGMEVFLPAPGRSLSDLVADLDADGWAEAVASLQHERVMVSLPRFELTYQADLSDPLAALGMPTAFGPGADFGPMSPAAPWLEVVAHKTYIRVDEEGTEAAAVTGGAMPTSMPPEFRVDRPFLFTVSDGETGAILFLGAVADPTA